MDTRDTETAMNRLFESIYNCVAPMPVNGETQKSFYTQLPAGSAVSGMGDKELAIMMDNIPAVQRDYAATKKVSSVYEKILSAVLPPDEPPKEKQDAYNEAKKLIQNDNPTYDAYKKARSVYNKAYLKYCRMKNDSKADAYDIEDAKMDMDDAYDDFIAAGKEEIECALSTVASYERYMPQAVFNRAGSVFGQASAEKDRNGYFPVDCVPANWKEPNTLAWEEITLMASSQTFVIANEAKKVEFSRKNEYSNGWWLWKEGTRVTEQEKEVLKAANSKMQTEDLSLTMELAVVEIDRPWFHAELLSYSEAKIKNEPAGVICSGTLTGGGEMPLIPSAFVLVRNVNVYN